MPELALALMLLAFGALAWTSSRHINALWDEMNDYRVAVSLLEQPLVGSGLDGNQARGPMYATALVYAITGPSLAVARGVSIAMGGLAVILTFAAGRRWFGTPAGLLAAGALSIAPYFLTFSRTAMTEGDAFCPATVLLMILAFERYLRERDSVRLVWFGAAFGLALAIKFYALLLAPALLICDCLIARRESEKNAGLAPPIAETARISGRDLLAWGWTAAGLQVLAGVLTQLGLFSAAVFCWAGGLLLLLAGAAGQMLAGSSMGRAAGRLRRAPPSRLVSWTAPAAWMLILPLAAAVCLAICPAHVLNPEIARTIARSVIRPLEAEPMMRFLDPARLYLGILFLKLGPLLGVLSLAAIVWACLQSAEQIGLAVSCSGAVLYILLLTALPFRQSFYLMSVYPLLLLMLAGFVVRVASRLRGRDRLRSAWLALVATGCLYLLCGTIRSYPEFGYYGYSLIGDRWLGAESRGYRNLIQVTNDGTEDALRWMNTHVPPGRRVVSYLWDDHVIDAFVESHPPSFHLVRREAYLARHRPPEIGDADFLVVSLNNYVGCTDLPPRQQWEANFDPLPRHVVYRGRGPYRMSVVQVFQRRSRPDIGDRTKDRHRLNPAVQGR